MKKIVRNMLIGFFAISFILISVATMTYINMSALVDREHQNKRSLTILHVIEEVYKNALDIESSMRGYLIVGDTNYLIHYKNGKKNLLYNNDTLIKYTAGYNGHFEDAKELKKYSVLLLNVSEELVNDEYHTKTDSVKRVRLLYVSKRYMDGIRKIIYEIETKERDYLKKTNRENIYKARLTKYGYFSTAILSIIILVIVFFIVRNELLRRLSAERKLLESSNRIFDLYNNAPCGYHSVGKNNIIIEMNDTELKWLGYERYEVIGKKTIFDLIKEKDHYKIHEFISEISKREGKTESLKDLEVCYVRKDGSCFEVMLNSSIIFDKNGVATTSRTAVLDITALKESENKVKALYKELEENNIRLVDANAELESFTYSVSHDLRAPLRAIDGYCQIVMEDYVDKLDDEAKRIFSIIMSNSKKMGILIDDLLDFSRLGRRETLSSLVDHNKLVSEILHETEIPEHYEIKVDELAECMADRSLFKHVWQNLISNAIKYSSKIVKPYIHIYSYINNNEIIYCIEDNGVGFDEHYKHKLFNVFQRLHHDDEYEGTGVGLAIVHKIITKHNGKIWAESKENELTKFYFSLPLE